MSAAMLAAIALALWGTVAASQACGMTLLNDTSCTHKAFKWTNETSFAGCCATCESQNKCIAWEYAPDMLAHKSPGNCHLKEEPGKTEKQPGTTCGFNPTPPTPPPPTPPPPPAPKGAPNICFFLTDDQDQMLGGSFPSLNGATPMPQTEALMANKGSMADNFYIHTPICCPSRSELLSGRYFHNIKTTGGPPACMHVNENKVNNATFALNLKQGGYRVGMFGKYLNAVPRQVPPGFDAWLANGGGDYISPAFATKNIDGLPDGHWKGSEANYSTSVIGNISIAWIRKVVKEDPKRPFFAYIAPKAAHEPFNPAPWYRDHWDASWPQHEPRPANWNCSKEMREKHPGVVATEAMIDDEAAAVITDVFKNRWRTLMSVDDVIAGVIATCEELQIMNTTYFFYTSDHGFQLGQFNIIMDKRHVYDWDTHIHLLVRGPGILPGSRFPYPATQVDLAPTFLGLAGLSVPQYMDGKSLVPLLVTVTPTSTPTTTTTTTTTPTTYSDMQGNGNAHRNQNKNNSNSTKSAIHRPTYTSSSQKEMEIEMEMEFPVLPATLRHLRSLPRFAQYAASWRQAVFIEYYFNSANTKCCGGCTNPKGTSGYPHKDAWCGDLSDNTQCWALYGCKTSCYPTESPANNYIALRSVDPQSPFGNTLYAEYQTGNQKNADVDFSKKVDAFEYYNATADPWMLDNAYSSATKDLQTALHVELQKWFKCAGASCP